MLTERVSRMLGLLDEQFVRNGGKPYAVLDSVRLDARARGDASALFESAVDMGVRLLSMATVARAMAGHLGASDELPPTDEVLEPAIDLLLQSLEAARSLGATGQIGFVNSRLGDAYLQSGQFAKARNILLEVAGNLTLPKDLWLKFDVAQKVGDCSIEIEDDVEALHWYEIAMSAARAIDDPFEIHVQHGKIAMALANLKRFDEATGQWSLARDLLLRIGTDADLRQKIVVHKNSFHVGAIPGLVESVDDQMAKAREGLGRELLRELPGYVGRQTIAAMSGSGRRPEPDWQVVRHLAVATQTAAAVLERMLEKQARAPADAKKGEPDPAEAQRRVAALTNAHFSIDLPAPTNLEAAARHLVHVDRSRRAAILARDAAGTQLGLGPDLGPGSRHVVYLRSFIASAQLPVWDVPPWGHVDLEELLACQLDTSPLIALGDPDFERFGPGRVQSTDENWRDLLYDLALTAQVLLVIPAMTRGTCWEIEWVVTNKLLHKTCFVMPSSQGVAQAWWTTNWAELRQWSVRLGIAIPEYSPRGSIFRLGTEGQAERMGFDVLYEDKLHYALLSLLLRPNLSGDFLYAWHQALENEGRVGQDTAASSPDSDGAADALLQRLQECERLEMSSWWRDEQRVSAAPGLLLLFEGPFRLLWVEDCDDMHAMLDDYAEGRSTQFTRLYFNLSVLDGLNGPQSSQLLDKTIGIDDVMQVQVKKWISFRWCESSDAALRADAVERVWQGGLRIGLPKFPRLAARSQQVSRGNDSSRSPE